MTDTTSTLGEANMLRRILFTLLLATALPAGATDYTDIWWNPAESGWGVNLAQNGNFIFATFFIYGPEKTPTWYTGHLQEDATGNFTGSLYATTGPWFGAVPFDPNQVGISQVGTATFQPNAADTGMLTYNVASMQVTKSIQRQTLVPIALVGNYVGGIAFTESSCTNSANNNRETAPANLLVTQTGANIQVTIDFFGVSSCSFTGPATQSGQLMAFPAAYSCSTGGKTTANVYELRATSLGVEGRWRANAGGCVEDGQFGGVRQ
jgi:hypothetical protein